MGAFEGKLRLNCGKIDSCQNNLIFFYIWTYLIFSGMCGWSIFWNFLKNGVAMVRHSDLFSHLICSSWDTWSCEFVFLAVLARRRILLNVLHKD